MNPRLVIVCLVYFVFFYFVYMLDEGVTKHVRSLRGSDMLKHMHNYKTHSGVDVVVLPPFVQTGEGKDNANYSVLSVYRFMPWVRRVHMYNPDEKHNLLTHWTQQQKSRFVTFHEPLVEYSLTTPFLSEQFIVLQSGYVVTNYVFPWQFFVEDTPVLRSCHTGMTALTRNLLNENVYIKNGIFGEPARHLYRHALSQGLRSRVIQYVNNRDHFSAPCRKKLLGLTSTRKFTTYKVDDLVPLFKFEKVHKRRKAPFDMVLCVTNNIEADVTYSLPEKYATAIHMWVIVNKLQPVHARISLHHRMRVQESMYLELNAETFQWKAESMAAEVIRRIRRLTKDPEAINVVEVFTHAHFQDRVSYDTGFKLSQMYQTSLSTLSNQHPFDTQERQRLQLL